MNRKSETKRAQAAASPKLHPRGLARSIAKAAGASKTWRETVAAMPAAGQRYLHPERHRKG